MEESKGWGGKEEEGQMEKNSSTVWEWLGFNEWVGTLDLASN